MAMGVVVLFYRQRRGYSGIIVFGVLIFVILTGKPYQASNSSRMMAVPELSDDILSQIDQTKYPVKDLQDLFFDLSREDALYAGRFMAIGVVKRLSVLEQMGSFALMKSVMFCCMADAFAIGFPVSGNETAQYRNGQWVMVAGQFAKMPEPIEVPDFRFGMAMHSSLNNEVVIQADIILPYDRTKQLPLLTELLDNDRLQVFRKALKRSGLWDDLEKEGAFTVFAPVDDAFESAYGQRMLDAGPEELRDILSFHIVPQKLMSNDLFKHDSIKTLHSRDISLHAEYGKIKVEKSRILINNLEAKNGVLHCIYPALRYPSAPQ